MKRSNEILLVAVALAASLFASNLNAQPGPKGPPEERRAKMGERLAEHLGLSADQQAKVQVIQDAARAEREAVMSDQSLSREQKREKMQGIQKATEAKMDEVLTPEQRTKAAEMRAKAKERMGERRGERRGPGQDGPPPPKSE